MPNLHGMIGRVSSPCPKCGVALSPFESARADCLACATDEEGRGGFGAKVAVIAPPKPSSLVCLETTGEHGYELKLPPKGARAIPAGVVGAAFVAAAGVALGHAFAGNSWAYVVAVVQGVLGLATVYLSVAAGLNTRRVSIGGGTFSARTGPVPTLMSPLSIPFADLATLGTEIPESDKHDPDCIYVKTTDGIFHSIDLDLEAGEAVYLAFALGAAVRDERRRVRERGEQSTYRAPPKLR